MVSATIAVEAFRAFAKECAGYEVDPVHGKCGLTLQNRDPGVQQIGLSNGVDEVIVEGQAFIGRLAAGPDPQQSGFQCDDCRCV